MQKKKRERIVLVLLATAVWLGSCNRKPENKTPATDEIAKLNSAPQQKYPEFTLEAQKAAMQLIEDERRKARIEGLREKIQPADWIEIAYHGLLLDANYDEIKLDRQTVAKIQESMFSILYQPVLEQANKKHGGELKQVFYTQQFQPEEQFVIRNAVLDSLLDMSAQNLQERYIWRHRLVRRGWSDQNAPQFTIAPGVLAYLREHNFVSEPPVPDGIGAEYVDRCRAEGVPIPPNWPDAGWKTLPAGGGRLAFTFINANLNAEVFTYEDPAVPGVCYALPRRIRNSESIKLLGIICQSKTTGKACFWDNRTLEDQEMPASANLQLKIENTGNGMTLGENCSSCHRGDNAFIIHPGTALDIPPSSANPLAGRVTDPAARYAPIGQAHWSNPASLVLPDQPPDQSCTSCHEIPQTGGWSYCSRVLENAAKITMPPFGTRAGWPTGSVPVNPSYAEHIRRLSACP